MSQFLSVSSFPDAHNQHTQPSVDFDVQLVLSSPPAKKRGTCAFRQLFGCKQHELRTIHPKASETRCRDAGSSRDSPPGGQTKARSAHIHHRSISLDSLRKPNNGPPHQRAGSSQEDVTSYIPRTPAPDYVSAFEAELYARPNEKSYRSSLPPHSPILLLSSHAVLHPPSLQLAIEPPRSASPISEVDDHEDGDEIRFAHSPDSISEDDDYPPPSPMIFSHRPLSYVAVDSVADMMAANNRPTLSIITPQRSASLISPSRGRTSSPSTAVGSRELSPTLPTTPAGHRWLRASTFPRNSRKVDITKAADQPPSPSPRAASSMRFLFKLFQRWNSSSPTPATSDASTKSRSIDAVHDTPPSSGASEGSNSFSTLRAMKSSSKIRW